MTSPARLHVAKARRVAIAVHRMIEAGLFEVATRDTYLAAFHAAQALVRLRAGRSVKTHAGLRSEFARLCKEDPRLNRDFSAFLARAYELKSVADYETGPYDAPTLAEAERAVEMDEGLIAVVEAILDTDEPR
jgi:uncharacterized protein (UPF0332 family)